MAHFAKISIEDNVVERVVKIDDSILLVSGIESEIKGAHYCQNKMGGVWKQTSFYPEFRKNFAGPGYTYDSDRDAFIPPKPYDSWVLDETTCRWEAPTACPTEIEEGKYYAWDENTTSWIKEDVF